MFIMFKIIFLLLLLTTNVFAEVGRKDWIRNGTDIYYSAGNVGIGALPLVKLMETLDTDNTNISTEMLRLTLTSTGTVAANFGASLDTYLEDASGNAAQQASSIGTIWTTATHGAESSAITFSGVTAGGALTEFGRFYGASAGTGGVLSVTVNALGESLTPTPGIILKNPTPDNGTIEQNSPALVFQGQGTGATNDLQQMAFFYIPNTGGGNFGVLNGYSKIGSGSWTNIFGLDNYGQWKNPVNYNNNNITDLTNPVVGLKCTADGTATSVLDKASPALQFYAPGWKTASTAASQYMGIHSEIVNEQGITSPIGVLVSYYGINTSTAARTNELLRYEWGDNFAIGMLGSKTPQASAVDINGDLVVAHQSDLGTEKITDGTAFASGWTLGAAWHIVSSAARKDTDGVTTLSQTSAAMVTPLVIGERYLLSFDVTNNTVTDGSMVVTCGGATRRNCTTNNGTYTWTFVASSTADLVFTPSLTTSRFYIDNVSLKKITGGDIYASGNLTLVGTARTDTSIYRRYYHLPMNSGNPGASGATWTNGTTNNLCGWQINASTELLDFQSDVHSDWDATSDLKVEIKFALLSAGSAGDTVDLKLVCKYMGINDTATKTQTIEVATVTDGTQYKFYQAVFTINYDETSNVVDVGDSICLQLNLETDTSEIDNVLIVDGSFYYNKNHIGIESGDV